MVTIKILAGSVRPNRFNIQFATWIYEQAKKRDDLEVELIDLAELDLPFLNEPTPPSQGKHELPHTKAWSERIAATDGFIFVTPEYNHSYSPALKNAIDYLFFEWHYKPVGFVSYGSLAGGARAVEHLRGVAGEVKMYDLREQILFPNYWENLDENGQYQFSERNAGSAQELLDTLVFWAERFKEARAKLPSA